MSDKITFRCSNCKSDQFIQPDHPEDEDTITCAKCGRTSTWGTLKASAIKQGTEAVNDLARKTFGNLFKKP